MATIEVIEAKARSERQRDAELESQGFRRDEATLLLQQAGVVVGELHTIGSIIADRLARESEDLESAKAGIRDSDQQVEVVQVQRRALLQAAGVPSDVPSGMGALAENIESTKRCLNELENIRKFVALSDDTDLIELSAKVSEVSKLVSQRLVVEAKIGELQTNEQRIVILEKEVVENQERARRAYEAEETLKGIRVEAGLDKRLEYFIRNNAGTVRDTFLRIHSPREFVDLLMTVQDLKLKRANGTFADARELSAGQRTALALSVFLTLNSLLKNGPDIILLDDPVVYVDDLNLLAFLDLLRDVAMKKNRQVFFASANTRVAELVKKKFDFMGVDFLPYSLKRIDLALLEPGDAVH